MSEEPRKLNWLRIIGFAGPFIVAALVIVFTQDLQFQPPREKKIRASLLRFRVPAATRVYVDSVQVPVDQPYRALPGFYDIRFLLQDGKEVVSRIQVKAGVNQILSPDSLPSAE